MIIQHLAFLLMLAMGGYNETTNTAAVGNCGNLILFQKGTVIESVSKDAAGKETGKQVSTVTDVKTVGGVMQADLKSETIAGGKKRPISFTYKCDGNNLYTDMTSVMQNFGTSGSTIKEITPISFPLSMSEGKTLPDASFVFTINMGSKKMDMKTTYKDRKVAARENVTTPAGSWNCYKITSNIESAITGADEATQKIADGMKDKMKSTMTMWYATTIGIVKVETYTNGQLTSTSMVTRITK
jgi:hypothetical protein